MEPRHRSRARAFWLLAALLSHSALSGCGAGGMAGSGQAPSSEQARELVRSALEAWKGGIAAGLARRDPPIRFVDPEQVGATLVDFKIREGEERSVGPVVDVPVELRVKDRKGKLRSIQTFFQVATQPGLAVLRNDPD